jgi:non-specific serine/threonine protein kinase
LEEALAALVPGFEMAAAAPLDLDCLLPSSTTAPSSSPFALAVEEHANVAPELRSWRIRGVALAPADALDFLAALPPQPRSGVRVADSLRFWGAAAALALELLARGRQVPALVQEDGLFAARWLPVFDDRIDAPRLAALAEAMPGACRAESDGGAAPAPAEVLRRFVQACVDAAVRRWLARTPIVPVRSRRARSPLVEEQWLHALVSESPVVEGPADLIGKLAADLKTWNDPLLTPAASPLRTCFRLSAPESGERDKAAGRKSWRLDFFLQASDDPSLLIEAEQIWRTRGDALTVLRRRFVNPQEKLLGDLGRALRLCPAIEPALHGARPAGLDLSADAAYAFLRESAPLLEGAGFGVLVPPWWTKPAARLGVRLSVKPKGDTSAAGSGLLGLDGLCDYRWQVALGDKALSFAEFQRLAKLKVPLVQVRGQWVELKREEIDAALAFFRSRQAEGEMSVGEALSTGLGLGPSRTGLPVVGFEAAGWIGALLTEDRALEARPAPPGFVGALRPYQERGLSWLAFLGGLGLGACLADDMGLGKTVQLLALLLAERAGVTRRTRREPTLLVCPMSVVGNWVRETERFAPTLAVHVHHGGGRLAGKALAKAVKNADLVITTYALAARDRDELAALSWGRVVLDEAQNIKNSAARQTQAVRAFRAAQRVALTGTPVENRLSDLWSIMEFLNPGLLGGAADFRTRFAIPIEKYRDESKAAQLRRVTQPFVLRRLKTDATIISDLPDKIEMKVYCNLTREQASLYQAVVDEMLAHIESSAGIARKGLVLATLMKLKQVCNHPAAMLQDRSALDGRSGKLERLAETLDEMLEEGDRALVFTQFAEWGSSLRAYLQERLGQEVLFLHGGTSRAARDAMVARFQGAAGPPVFLLSVKAGGTGLNLTAANHVIHFDRWWNPAVEDQATDRTFRIGQRRNVQVRKFICIGTLEERIDALLEGKRDLAQRIVGSGESWLTELSTAQIRDLVALGRDAVSEG